MRKFILSAAVLLLSVPNLMAQDEGQFGWDSHIINRTGTEVTPNGNFRVDSNRFDMTVPMYIGDATDGFTVRGVGQILAPRWSYPVFKDEYTGNTSESTDFINDPTSRDVDYINQFKGVQNWQLTDIRFSLFQNSNISTTTPAAQVAFFRMNTDYSAARNRDSLIVWTRDVLDASQITTNDLPYVLDGAALDGTVDDRGAIVPTIISFDPPLDFTKEQSVMMLYINDFADTVHQPIGGETDMRDWQRMIGYFEYRDGRGFTGDTALRNPVPNAMATGVYMRRPLNGTSANDTVIKTFSLNVGGIPARMNFNVQWVGNVELLETDIPEIASSVKYYFGVDAGEQGLQNVMPNPAREEATIPFSLAETSNVTLELYTVDGQKVETLLKDKRYVEGKYTVHINSSDLQSGAYLVRMTANEKVYSMKFNVTK
ncbi:MAG: T9SS type A sorting domain-containing protein [Ignavibacteriae bacterium]|nr:T9SS type A sorting domain-containing protein [Ignavibacteriota bacterium]MCB9216493.1 T9SS type A sorting domain-containing protein [Ignavibacteria bacterium]